MKKLLITGAIIAGLASTATIASGSATASGQAISNIIAPVTPISMAHRGDVVFGTMTAPSSAGQQLVVRMSPINHASISVEPSTTGGSLDANSQSHAARYVVYGGANATYGVSLTNASCPVAGVSLFDMEFWAQTGNSQSIGTLNHAGEDDLHIGGKLAVNHGVSGSVTCTYDATVSYQ